MSWSDSRFCFGFLGALWGRLIGEGVGKYFWGKDCEENKSCKY